MPSNNVLLTGRFTGAATLAPANFDRRARRTFVITVTEVDVTCFARGVTRISREPWKVPSRTTEIRE